MNYHIRNIIGLLSLTSIAIAVNMWSTAGALLFVGVVLGLIFLDQTLGSDK